MSKSPTDHRDIGKQMDLFMFHPLSPGMAIWLPKGNTVYGTLSDKIRELNVRNGYVEVRTPLLWKKELFATSGHLDHFSKNMFSVEGDDNFLLKPMNCPAHMIIFKSKHWSYADLPYRIHDQGVLHRNEVSGAIGGLTRCRSFCQDDGHVFTTPEALDGEVDKIIKMVQKVYYTFGMSIHASLSTRPASHMGEKGQWDHAESTLKQCLSGVSYEVADGEGAFYGPKIDFTIKDSEGRSWQTATIQLDFQLPLRFELEYTTKENKQATPIVIHRAIYGSFERFIGILLEHYDGNLPIWLAPIQCTVLPISEKHLSYCRLLSKQLEYEGVKAKVDETNTPLAHKIAVAKSQKIPYLAVVGDTEQNNLTVNIRGEGAMTVNDFVSKMSREAIFSF